jgi:hypothetical protein
LHDLVKGDCLSVKRFAGSIVVVLLAALPAEAAADIRFKGESGQNRLVTLRTADDGMLERMGIRWQAPCKDPGFAFRTGTFFRPPFDRVSRERFLDAGTNRLRMRGRLRAVMKVRVAGNRVSERRWRGIFRTSVRVLRGGRLIDRCYKRTAWRVVRQG